VFENLFGGARTRAPRARRGSDLETVLELDFVEAALGCERRITLQRPAAGGGPAEKQTLKIRIPAGVATGSKIRLSGQGAPGTAGGPSGDLFARIRVRPHPVFRRDGRDIRMEASIGVSEAILGTEFQIPTLDGQVLLRVPPGTDSGSKLRLQGKGIPAANGTGPGDLYVEIRIRVPDRRPRQPRSPGPARRSFQLSPRATATSRRGAERGNAKTSPAPAAAP
jgi:DnaJ-class molecular chaperone